MLSQSCRILHFAAVDLSWRLNVSTRTPQGNFGKCFHMLTAGFQTTLLPTCSKHTTTAEEYSHFCSMYPSVFCLIHSMLPAFPRCSFYIPSVASVFPLQLVYNLLSSPLSIESVSVYSFSLTCCISGLKRMKLMEQKSTHFNKNQWTENDQSVLNLIYFFQMFFTQGLKQCVFLLLKC